MIDVDHFKRINDEHGHPAGDAVLREMAQLLRETLRTMDALGRYGGEEFVAVLPHTGAEEARQTAERMRYQVQQRRFHGGRARSASASAWAWPPARRRESTRRRPCCARRTRRCIAPKRRAGIASPDVKTVGRPPPYEIERGRPDRSLSYRIEVRFKRVLSKPAISWYFPLPTFWPYWDRL